MVRLHRTVEGLGCEVLAKLEFLNPMGSCKDRIGRNMVERALEDGRLRPGGVIVENSSGNTAMGLAMMAILNGLTCRMVVRKQTSKEKLDCLRAVGVELVLVDGALPPSTRTVTTAKPARSRPRPPARSCRTSTTTGEQRGPLPHHRARDLGADGGADRRPGGRGRHRRTISGIARFLKEAGPGVRVIGVDPRGVGVLRLLPHRHPREALPLLSRGARRRGDHRLPGVGPDRRPGAGHRPGGVPGHPGARPLRGHPRRRLERRRPVRGAPGGGEAPAPVRFTAPASQPCSPTPARATCPASTATTGCRSHGFMD